MFKKPQIFIYGDQTNLISFVNIGSFSALLGIFLHAKPQVIRIKEYFELMHV